MSKGNRARRRAAGLLPEPAKCSARTQNGDPCKNSPIAGSTVCRMHGGAAGQVKRKAQERLEKGVLPLLGRLYKLATDESVPAAVRLAAIRDWLDRAGINSKIEIEVDMPWKDVIAGIVAEVDEDQLMSAQNYLHRQSPPPPRELEEYVDAEVVEDDPYARAEAASYAGRPESSPVIAPQRQPDGPRIRQANVRAD